MNDHEIPQEFWRELAKEAKHPMACVGTDSIFVWVNSAFEDLLGYNRAELYTKTWMDVTYQPDIGGDYAAVQSILAGKMEHYSMDKTYIHKRGHKVPIQLRVCRFPRGYLDRIICFMVEAAPAKATRSELDQLENRVQQMVNDLKEHQAGVNVSYSREGDVSGDRVGRDKNSDSAIKVLAGAMAGMFLCIVWLIYYVATIANKTTPSTPPAVNVSK